MGSLHRSVRCEHMGHSQEGVSREVPLGPVESGELGAPPRWTHNPVLPSRPPQNLWSAPGAIPGALIL